MVAVSVGQGLLPVVVLPAGARLAVIHDGFPQRCSFLFLDLAVRKLSVLIWSFGQHIWAEVLLTRCIFPPSTLWTATTFEALRQFLGQVSRESGGMYGLTSRRGFKSGFAKATLMDNGKGSATRMILTDLPCFPFSFHAAFTELILPAGR